MSAVLRIATRRQWAGFWLLRSRVRRLDQRGSKALGKSQRCVSASTMMQGDLR